MNKNLKTLLFIISIFVAGFLSLIALMFIGSFAKAMGECENIGERYEICYGEGRDMLLISHTVRDWDISTDSLAIQRYEYDDDFALLFGWDSPQAVRKIEQDSIIRDSKQTLELFKEENKPFFMIIDKRNDSIHLPLTLTEYLTLRRELGVPDDLQLKLRL